MNYGFAANLQRHANFFEGGRQSFFGDEGLDEVEHGLLPGAERFDNDPAARGQDASPRLPGFPYFLEFEL